ncbi:MAG: PIN domain-containing protein [Gemmatimonadaceae bacterium]
MGVVIDTSALIAAERGRFDMPGFLRSVGDAPVGIAAITASELLHGVERAKGATERSRRARFVEALLALLPVLPFGLIEARQHASIWAAIVVKGQSIGAHDLLIAATALGVGFEVCTLNAKDFGRVPGLVLASAAPYLIRR